MDINHCYQVDDPNHFQVKDVQVYFDVYFWYCGHDKWMTPINP